MERRRGGPAAVDRVGQRASLNPGEGKARVGRGGQNLAEWTKLGGLPNGAIGRGTRGAPGRAPTWTPTSAFFGFLERLKPPFLTSCARAAEPLVAVMAPFCLEHLTMIMVVTTAPRRCPQRRVVDCRGRCGSHQRRHRWRLNGGFGRGGIWSGSRAGASRVPRPMAPFGSPPSFVHSAKFCPPLPRGPHASRLTWPGGGGDAGWKGGGGGPPPSIG